MIIPGNIMFRSWTFGDFLLFSFFLFLFVWSSCLVLSELRFEVRPPFHSLFFPRSFSSYATMHYIAISDLFLFPPQSAINVYIGDLPHFLPISLQQRMRHSSMDNPHQALVACEIVHTALRLWRLHCFQTHMFVGREIFQLHGVCQGCCQCISTTTLLQAWLRKHEGGRGVAIGRRVTVLYMEYSAAILQRVFLREAQSLLRFVAIAGSFPSSKYLEERGVCDWRPNDIDLFVHSRDAVDVLERMYTEIVAGPLHLNVDRHFGPASALDTNDDLYNNRISLSLTSNGLRGMSLADDIAAWIDCNDVAASGCAEAVRLDLRETLNHVPSRRVAAGYDVLLTLHLRPWCVHTVPSQTLLPVNIILITPFEGSYEESAFARKVCQSFDVTLCCVSLSVDSDLTFILEGYDDSFAALDARKLILREQAFADVRSQMNRIRKYLKRGFSW